MDTIKLAYEIRRHVIEMTHTSRASHVASALSTADILAVLYGSVMKIYPDDPCNSSRDRFILSKGHAGAAVYAVLSETGFFPISELRNYYQDGSTLSGHISHKNVPGVEVSTGSLGHGVSVACGMAMAARMDDRKHHVFVLMGDGECEEGSVWEMALFASHNKLTNFTVIIDHNQYQAMGTCEFVCSLNNLADKWNSFGFETIECDGHNHDDMAKVLRMQGSDKPVCIIAHTVKGKGISFMENNLLWHYRDPQGEFYENALKELEEHYIAQCSR